VVVAQYLASIYIIHDKAEWKHVLLDLNLFLLALSSSFLIAAGYIINGFYDSEKDMINKPDVAIFNQIVSKPFRLYCYFTFNTIGVLLALMVNLEIVVFHFMFSFGLWLYSHKFKKILFVGNITGTLLSIVPFFSISIYYHTITPFIVLYVGFVFLIELTREIVKDMMAMKGDLIMGYNTIPVEFGLKKSKWIVLVFQAMTVSIPFFLYMIKGVSMIMLYFLFSALLICISMVMLLISDNEINFSRVNTIYKFILLAGIMSIALF
jgi:4-hydroxybenzoate polyprenyltransferase